MASAFKPAFNVKMTTIEDFDFLNSDIVAFPGGIGDADEFYKIFNGGHIRKLKRFLDNGGKYLGICMGAYWAGAQYFNILGDADAVQYITQPNTDIETEWQTIANVKWYDKNYKMYFYDGCAIVGELDETEIIATYANGDAMAVIKNGVGVIGCHPESEKWWHDEIGYWHHGICNKLLQEFAIDL
ncbi:MAG: BPL-N domain-containing protein [Bacteroidia bacterium]